MNNINCCIIALQRYEPYLNFWIDYHLNYGFSHIFLLDNNDYGDEVELPIKYKSTVTLLQCNHILNLYDLDTNYQVKLYNAALEFIKKLNSKYYSYTHCLVIDIDEYFYSINYNNINNFLENNPCDDTLSIWWHCYNDNNIIYKKELKYNNPIDNYPYYDINDDVLTITHKHSYKSFVKINNNTILGVHIHNNYDFNNPPNVINEDIAYIKHYRTGCVEEYIDKCIKRRTNTAPYFYNYGTNNIKLFFDYNEITNDKLNAFKKLYKKYNLTMSESDNLFIENNYK